MRPGSQAGQFRYSHSNSQNRVKSRFVIIISRKYREKQNTTLRFLSWYLQVNEVLRMVSMHLGPQAGQFRYSHITGQNRIKITFANQYFEQISTKMEIPLWDFFHCS
jgi:hypothetical protein